MCAILAVASRAMAAATPASFLLKECNRVLPAKIRIFIALIVDSLGMPDKIATFPSCRVYATEQSAVVPMHPPRHVVSADF